MHGQVRKFVEQVRRLFPKHFYDCSVLEVGSRIWGAQKKPSLWKTPRHLFRNCDYTGIDMVEGEGVDVVTMAHWYDAEPNTFDTILCLETLEHDQFWVGTLASIRKWLKPDGLLIVTCATHLRPEHEVPEDGPGAGYYRNLEQKHVLSLLLPAKQVGVYCAREHWDLLLWMKGKCDHSAKPNPPT